MTLLRQRMLDALVLRGMAIRTQEASGFGRASFSSSSARKPSHRTRPDQHCTHFRRLLCVMRGSRSRSASFKRRGGPARPSIARSQLRASGAGTGLNSITFR